MLADIWFHGHTRCDIHSKTLYGRTTKLAVDRPGIQTVIDRAACNAAHTLPLTVHQQANMLIQNWGMAQAVALGMTGKK